MRHDEGFTLTEMLVAMVISVVAMSAVYSAYMSQQKAYQVTEEVAAVQQNLRGAMYHLEKDIREAGYDPKGSKNFPLVTMNPTSFTFKSDLDGDMALDTNETITYQYDGAEQTLEKNEGGGAQDMAMYISGVSFQYLDQNGAATATASAVRSVEITLQGTYKGHVRELTSRIRCRNLGL